MEAKGGDAAKESGAGTKEGKGSQGPAAKKAKTEGSGKAEEGKGSQEEKEQEGKEDDDEEEEEEEEVPPSFELPYELETYRGAVGDKKAMMKVGVGCRCGSRSSFESA